MPSLLKGSTFFVLPSIADEVLPMVLLEAMTAGLPVIASDLGGVPELVTNDETGLLVPGGDVEALSAALRRLCIDVDLRTTLGMASRSTARHYSWPAIADQYMAAYNDAVAARQ